MSKYASLDFEDCNGDDQHHHPRRVRNDLNNDYDTNNDILFQQALLQGRQEGKIAGEKQGFFDGKQLGQAKGIEYGMEIGFATGLLRAVEKYVSSTEIQDVTTSAASTEKEKRQIDRIQKSACELQKAIDDFPTNVEQLFSLKDDKVMPTEEGNDSDGHEGRNIIDVRDKLQRIKARSKVLMAKLGIPHHSLKTVLHQQQHQEVLPKFASKPTSEDTASPKQPSTTSTTSIINSNEHNSLPASSSNEW
jgi:hypothetical protein